jgi:hypothetical protein
MDSKMKSWTVSWLIHKAKTEEPKTELQQLQTAVRSTGLAGVR